PAGRRRQTAATGVCRFRCNVQPLTGPAGRQRQTAATDVCCLLGVVRQETRINAPCEVRRQGCFAGGLAGAAPTQAVMCVLIGMCLQQSCWTAETNRRYGCVPLSLQCSTAYRPCWTAETNRRYGCVPLSLQCSTAYRPCWTAETNRRYGCVPLSLQCSTAYRSNAAPTNHRCAIELPHHY
ncbi:MAG: hypothetical protein GFH25_541206n1, partial [Chloroflexi bacterium AL-N10]|nr:hypothetical protein [Chloroflexi bacterium AL-N10]